MKLYSAARPLSQAGMNGANDHETIEDVVFWSRSTNQAGSNLFLEPLVSEELI